MVFHFLIHKFQRRQSKLQIYSKNRLFKLWLLCFNKNISSPYGSWNVLGLQLRGREKKTSFFSWSCASYRLNSLMIFLNINYSRSARYTCAKLPCRHLLPITPPTQLVSYHFAIAQQTHTLFCGDQTAHKTANCIKPSDLQKIPQSPKKHSFSDDFPVYKGFSCNWLVWHLQRSEWWFLSIHSHSVTLTLKACECLCKVSMKVSGGRIYMNFQTQ